MRSPCGARTPLVNLRECTHIKIKITHHENPACSVWGVRGKAWGGYEATNEKHTHCPLANMGETLLAVPVLLVVSHERGEPTGYTMQDLHVTLTLTLTWSPEWGRTNCAADHVARLLPQQ